MENVARRSMLAAATLSTAGALALSPITVAPPALHAPSISAARISSQAVQLTDAWSELASHTVANVVQLAATAFGVNSNIPLPNPTIPLAPIATQLVLNQLIYVAQVFTGQGASIPGEIGAHLTGVLGVATEVGKALPEVITTQIQLPIAAVQAAIDTYTGSGSLLQGLFEAPAAFLDTILNNDVGLLGIYGPIGLPLVVRNLVAKALYTTPPTLVLPFKKASAATLRPKAADTTSRPQKSGVAGSARPEAKAPSAASASAKKVSAAKSSNGGSGRGKRG